MYLFHATAHQQTNAFVCASQISVRQKVDDHSSVLVARIEDSADPADHRVTTIRYAGGILRFSAAYDGPIRPHVIFPFSDSGISLHVFDSDRSRTQSYLCSENRFFPIRVGCNDKGFEICIYPPSPIPEGDGLLHPPLAAIKKTKTYSYGFEYAVQVRELLPLPLLMAIFSLPFTLNLPIA